MPNIAQDPFGLYTELEELSHEDKSCVLRAREQLVSRCMDFHVSLDTYKIPCDGVTRARKGYSAIVDPDTGKKIQVHDGRIRFAYIPDGTESILNEYGRYQDGTVFTEQEIDAAMALIHVIGVRNCDENVEYHDDDWKSLHSSVIQSLTRKVLDKQKRSSKEFLEALVSAGLIDVDWTYQFTPRQHDGKTRAYRLAEKMRERRKHVYGLSEPLRWQNLHVRPANELESAITESHAYLTLPCVAEINAKAIELNGTRHKGKTLVLCKNNARKRSRKELDDNGKVRVLEGDIERYKRIISQGIKIPCAPGDFPRVIDTFGQMPYWICNMVKIDGEQSVELDFTSLHPQLLYGILKPMLPQNEQYTFEKVLSADGDVHLGVARMLKSMYKAYSDRTEDDIRSEVKIEHLSFFNRRWDDLIRHKPYRVYQRLETFMRLNKAIKECTGGYRNTSRILFSLEVSLMTSIVRELHSRGIHFIYKYDALLVPASKKDVVAELMNSVASRCGLLAKVKT